MGPRYQFRYKGVRNDSTLTSGEFWATENEFRSWCKRRFRWGWPEVAVTSPGGPHGAFLPVAVIRALPSPPGVQYNPRVLEILVHGTRVEVLRE